MANGPASGSAEAVTSGEVSQANGDGNGATPAAAAAVEGENEEIDLMLAQLSIQDPGAAGGEDSEEGAPLPL